MLTRVAAFPVACFAGPFALLACFASFSSERGCADEVEAPLLVLRRNDLNGGLTDLGETQKLDSQIEDVILHVGV